MRNFIEIMRERGLVTDITEPCSSVFEAPKMASSTSKILFFHNVDGKKAVMNLTADRESLVVALDIPSHELVKTLATKKMDGRLHEKGALFIGPPDLTKIPIMHHYPKDAGRYITAGVVFSRYHEEFNASIHRMLVLDNTRLAARLVEGRHTDNLHKKALSNGEVLPVAIAIGLHPAVIFACCTRVPPGKELNYASELMGGDLWLYDCGNGVLVPDAEIVLVGYIGKENVPEGPFVDITGTYDSVREQPVITITGMFMKEGCIYHGILPGADEHKVLMGAPYEPKIYSAVAGVTEVKNVVLTKGGCGYLHAVIQIKKRTPGDPKNAIMAAFAAHTSLKHVVIVDDDINPLEMDEVEYALATRVRGDTDLMVITGVRGSSLDPVQCEDGTNVKIGVDATYPFGRETEFRKAEW